MTKLRYRLRDDVMLLRTPGGLFCLSRMPLRAFRINESCFRLLEGLRNGGNAVISSEADYYVLDRLAERGILYRREVPDTTRLPFVSVIIPVRNRADDLGDCLEAIRRLSYPVDRLEVIVVDDASDDRGLETALSFGARAFRMESPAGQSACRNLGSLKAKGEILAFLDSDCIPTRDWLLALTPHLERSKIAAVGGLVEGYTEATPVARYQKTSSPLNMGPREILAGPGPSPFYLPTCNLLVKRKIFLELGGFREDLRVGEDVDLCWRLRNAGHSILYVPEGLVHHKHPEGLFHMMKKRFDYGSSEALLLLRHPEKLKAWPLSAGRGTFLAAAAVFLLFPSLVTASLPLIVLGGNLLSRFLMVKRRRIPGLKPSWILGAALRADVSCLYGASCFLVRYYLVPLLVASALTVRLLLPAAVAFAISLAGFICIKKPRLSLPSCGAIFLLEHAAYQLGVFAGCLRSKNPKPLFLRLRPRGGLEGGRQKGRSLVGR